MDNIPKIENNCNSIGNKAFFYSNSSNNKILNYNNLEELKEAQFYLITLEDNNGQHQQIRIFKNSDPSEIAFNFCKENNLDFKSMKYIKKNIQKIIEQFDEPNHKLFFLDNSYSSIQEVDEENLASENTIKSKNSVVYNEGNGVNKEKTNSNNGALFEKNDNDDNIKETILDDVVKNNKDDDINNKEYIKKNNIDDNNKQELNDNNKDENKKKNDIYNNNEKSRNINNNFIDNDINKNNINNKIMDNKIIDNKITSVDINNIIPKNNNIKDIINKKGNSYIIKEKVDNVNKIGNKNINNNDKKIKKDENLELNKKNHNFSDYNHDNYKNTSKIKDSNNNKNNKILYIKEKANNVIDKNIDIPNKNHSSFKLLKGFEEKKNEIQAYKVKKNINQSLNGKLNHKIKKDISNLIQKNFTENSLNSNNNNIYKKLYNKITKLYKYINPKQHLINEEYKIIKRKELSRENIIDKFFKILNKTQKEKLKEKSKSKSKEKYKTIDKEKDVKINNTFITISHSNLKIKKDKEYNNKYCINTELNIKKKNKNKKTLAPILPGKKINKSSSNFKKNFTFLESDIKKCNKTKDDINLGTPSNIFVKTRKKSISNISIIKKNNSNKKIKRKLKSIKEKNDNMIYNSFIINNSKMNGNSIHSNILAQIYDKCLKNNKSTKNKFIIKRNDKPIYDNDISKLSNDTNKQNDISQNNCFEKSIRTVEIESGSKSKRISEMRNGLSKMYNNFIGQKNNILNTNYIINKRCRIINNKNKKKMSMNLSRYILDYNKKINKSPKFNLEINVSNNNIENLTLRDYHTNKIQKNIYGKNNNIFSYNFYSKDSFRNNNNQSNIMSSSKKNHLKLLNNQNQSIICRYNTNFNNNNSRMLSSIVAYSKNRRKIVRIKKDKANNKNNNSHLKNKKYITLKNKDMNNNLNTSNSLFINNDKNNKNNDCCLKILDQYYTINNTINITNNNSLLNSFSNNNLNHRKIFKNENFEKIDGVKNLVKNLFSYFDRDNNEFIIISYKKKIEEILNTKKVGINKEPRKVLAKMIQFFFDINKRNGTIEFDEDKIIINKNLFIKLMVYIYNNKLTIYEKKLLNSTKYDIDRNIKKNFTENTYNFKPKSSFNRYKNNKFYLSTYNSSSRLNYTKDNHSLSSFFH